jgi:hypothetical protein
MGGVHARNRAMQTRHAQVPAARASHARTHTGCNRRGGDNSDIRAAAHDAEATLMHICQKPASERTHEDIRWGRQWFR